jgi:hypothetical protein
MSDYEEAWFTEQPTLREIYLELETVREEAETRILQKLDSVCTLSSPRVAFEMRLLHLARTSTWNICSGMMRGEKSRDMKKEVFEYELISESLFRLEDDDNEFLMEDHGNDVSFGELAQQDHDSFVQKIFLSVKPKKDLESMTVAS